MTMHRAIVDRWNNAGLDESINLLWLGSPEGPEHLIKAGGSDLKSDGGPKNEKLPRARYVVLDQMELYRTSASKIMKAPFFFFLYSKSPADLGTYTEDVISAFENSDKFSENPFEIDEGCIVNLDWVGTQQNTGYGEVLFSEIAFECIYTRPRIKPS
jgi:hypothetical protein